MGITKNVEFYADIKKVLKCSKSAPKQSFSISSSKTFSSPQKICSGNNFFSCTFSSKFWI